MAGQNQFFPFANVAGANVLSASSWGASSRRQGGFQSGIAPSTDCNTAWRQAAAWANVLGQFTANRSFDALDNGDQDALLANFEAALLNAFQGASSGTQVVHVGQDTGSVNAIVANVFPDIPLYQQFALFLIRIANTNTGACVANLDGRGTVPVVRSDGLPLQGGDILKDSVVALVFDGAVLRLMTPGQAEIPRLAPNAIYHVRPDGSDSNNGLSNSPTGAFATISRAQDALKNTFLAGTTATINLGIPGTYAYPEITPFTQNLVILGDVNAQDNYTLQGPATTGTQLVGAAPGQTLTLRGVRVNNPGTSRNNVYANPNSTVILDYVTIDGVSAPSIARIFGAEGSSITLRDGCKLRGNNAAMLSTTGGRIGIATNATILVQGTPSSATAFAVAGNFGRIAPSGGASFSGNATGPRYNAARKSIISVGGGGQNYFPGDQPGVTSDDSDYYP